MPDKGFALLLNGGLEVRPRGDQIEEGRGSARIASLTSPPLVNPSNLIHIKVGLGLRMESLI